MRTKKMKIFKYLLIALISFVTFNVNAQNIIFGCTDTAAANYDSTATQQLEGNVEFPVGCNQTGWFGNYVGINLALYQNNPLEFAVGTKVTIAGYNYWIDAMNVPTNCNVGVALIYVANTPGLADGNWMTQGGVILGAGAIPGDQWNITECFYNPGCMDPDYIEYDSSANWDDGSCQTLILKGCTDSTSLNYNPWANTDDSSCISNFSCGFHKVGISVTLKLDNWPSETSWLLLRTTGNVTDTAYYAPRGTYNYQQQGQTIVTNFCANAGPNHYLQFVLQDSYGDGIRGSQPPTNSGYCLVENIDCPDTLFYMSEANADFGYVITSDGNYWSQRSSYCGPTPIFGCTDPAYQEYDSLATVDDTSCANLHIYGCMDTNSINYYSSYTAWNNIETCEYRVILEDDGGDGWGESFIGIKQGSQLWDFTLEPGTYVDTFYVNFIVKDTLGLQDPVEMYYFEIGDDQQSTQQIDIQTIQNSVKIENNYGILIQEGNFPWANGNKLKTYKTTADIYSGTPFCGYVCTPKVYGCMDLTSLNYNPNANTDDGSCIPIIYGCMNPLAFNYDSTATISDNNCIAIVYGCTDPISFNYDPNANIDNGTCIYLGCTDNIACNYDSTANVDNGGCVYPVQYYNCNYICLDDTDGDGICDSLEIVGCTNPLSINYNSNATDNDGSCIPYVYGCLDPTSFNYDSLANTADGSCIPVVLGCTDPTSLNYDPNANTNNGSCITPVYGCTDPTSFNYNAIANVDNGSCITIIYGCTDSTMFNYNILANTDNGTCIPYVYGCTDSTALNYNLLANKDDNSCIAKVFGCTNLTAFNYDPLANTDDGTCIPIIPGCIDPTMFNYNSNANTSDGSCIPYVYGCTDPVSFNYDSTANTDNGSCLPIVFGCTDSTAFNYDPLSNTNNGSCIPIVYGCTDPSAFNYNPAANTEDFSCITVIYGCTDSLSINYDSTANVDNGSCITGIPGCTDPNAYNFNPNANVPDSASCLYDAGCITGPGNPYWLNDQCYAWVISIDPYCCSVGWDANCQNTYDYCDQNSTWTGIEDLIYDGGIAIYPNPTKDEINVVSSRFKNVLVTLYSISGQVVINETNDKVIDLNNLQDGVYFMHISVAELTYIRKVIKQ